MSKESWLVLACQAGILAVAGVLWQIAGKVGWVDPDVLPPLSKVVAVLWQILHQRSFLIDIRVTLLEIGTAFVLVVPVGLFIGLFIGEQRAVYRAVNPMLQLLMAAPKAVFLPVFILTFGIGFFEKVLFATLLGIFVVILSGIAAAHSVPEGLVTAVRSIGATRMQLYLRVYLPAMFPLILGGVRIGLIFTIFGVLLGEMYASSQGIGQAIFAWGEAFHMPELLASVLLVTVATICLNEMLSWLERYSFKRSRART